MKPVQIDLVLIDDDSDEAELILRALKKINITENLLCFSNGEEALTYLFQSGNNTFPKLILLDLKMPLVDGFEILKKLKNDPERKVIPVVALSSSQERQDIHQAYNLGANAYVVKPVDYSEFNEALVQIVRFWLSLNQTPGLSGI